MAPVRLRHPNGVTTIQVDFDRSTVQDLQQEVFTVTKILPSQQELKTGYPAHSLTLIPELPLSSLGLKQGEQIIVTEKSPVGGPPITSQPTSPTTTTTRSRAPAPVAPIGFPREVQQPLSPAAPSSSSSSGPDYVQTDGGYLVHRIVPDDNSCLFSSVALIFEQDLTKAQAIRKVVADAIREDPTTWSDAILGRPREEYMSTIQKPSSWGGAIELTILAAHYATEISSIDVETGRIDHFTPQADHDSGNRCILIYSGIHYDAATIAPILDAPADFHQTLIPVVSPGDGDPVLVAAKKLADKLRGKKAFTNTATFDLKCETCGKGLKGEKEARAHAQDTGHTDFGEY